MAGAYDGKDRVFERHRADDKGELVLPTTAEPTSVSAWLGNEASSEEFLEPADGESLDVELLLEACGAVQGRVVDALSGLPIEGAEVWVPTFHPAERVLTDTDGRFVYPRFPAFENSGRGMKARAADHGLVERHIGMGVGGAWYVMKLGSSEYEHETDGQAPPLRVDFELPPQVSYSGRVVDTTGAPVAGASVDARGYYATGMGIYSPDTAAATTDADGFYRVTGLRHDTAHTLWFRAVGFGTALRHSFPETRTSGDLGVTVLHAGCGLQITLLDSEGLPAEGFTVMLRWTDPDPPLVPASSEDDRRIFAPYALDEEQPTDDGGVALFADLPQGEWSVSIPAPRSWRRKHIKRTELLEGGQVRQLDLQLPADTYTVHGMVTRHSIPVEGAEVSSYGSTRVIAPARTDSSGNFRIAGQRREANRYLEATWTDAETGRRWSAELESDALVVTLELQLAAKPR